MALKTEPHKQSVPFILPLDCSDLLDPMRYYIFQDKMSAVILKSKSPNIDYMFNLAVSRYDIQPDTAAEYVERFMFDINRRLDHQIPAPVKKRVLVLKMSFKKQKTS